MPVLTLQQIKMVGQLATAVRPPLRRRRGSLTSLSVLGAGSAGGRWDAAPSGLVPVVGWAVRGRARLRVTRGLGEAALAPAARRGTTWSRSPLDKISPTLSASSSSSAPRPPDAAEREAPLNKQILVSVDRAETRVAIMEDGRAAECLHRAARPALGRRPRLEGPGRERARRAWRPPSSRSAWRRTASCTSTRSSRWASPSASARSPTCSSAATRSWCRPPRTPWAPRACA